MPGHRPLCITAARPAVRHVRMESRKAGGRRRSLPTQSMSDDPNSNPNPLSPHATAATFRTVPPPAESFSKDPNVAESFGTIPHGAEGFRTVPHTSEPLPSPDWRESYTLTVREAARLFETAGVARSERSIVNWCQQNRQSIARLDAYFDPNERRYFITRQSVDTIIAEEKARAAKANAEPVPRRAEASGAPLNPDAEEFRKVPSSSGAVNAGSPTETAELAELRKENLDLKITNRGKDYFIDQMKLERDGLVKQLVDSSHRVGQLETKLLLLGSHDGDTSRRESDPTDDLIESR